jgi:hypothetical protein
MNIQDRTESQSLPPITLFLGGLVFALVVGLVGGGDYEQQVADAQYTCNMVKDKAWPSAMKPECAPRALEAPVQLAKL